MCFYAHFTSHEPVSTVRFTHASIHISNASSFSISHFPTAHVFDACSVTVRQFIIIFFRKQKQNNARKNLPCSLVLFDFSLLSVKYSSQFSCQMEYVQWQKRQQPPLQTDKKLKSPYILSSSIKSSNHKL